MILVLYTEIYKNNWFQDEICFYSAAVIPFKVLYMVFEIFSLVFVGEVYN